MKPEMIVECKFDIFVPVKDIVPDPRNTNEHPMEQIEYYAKILILNKVRRPIVISNLSKKITKGEGAWHAAQYNGWTEYPVEYQDYESAADELADISADNELQRLSHRNEEKFIQVTQEMHQKDPSFDVERLGIPHFTLNEGLIEDVPHPDNPDEAKHKPTRKITCPDCGYIWDANAIEE